MTEDGMLETMAEIDALLKRAKINPAPLYVVWVGNGGVNFCRHRVTDKSHREGSSLCGVDGDCLVTGAKDNWLNSYLGESGKDLGVPSLQTGYFTNYFFALAYYNRLRKKAAA